MVRKLMIFLAMLLLVAGLDFFPAAHGVMAAKDAFKPLVVADYDFENGDTQGWVPRGGGVAINSVNEVAQAGSYSLKVSGRTANWNGQSLDVINLFQKGAVYNITGYIKLANTPRKPSTVKFTVEEKAGGGTNWKTVTQKDIMNTKWQKLSGSYTFNKDMDSLLLYAESSDPNEDFYLDSVTITMTAPPPQAATNDAATAKTDAAATSDFQKGFPALKDVFADYFAVGAAVEPFQLAGPVSALLRKHFNSIVAENAMKPEAMEPREGVFNWLNADRIIEFAEANGMKVRFHNLLWHEQVPRWFFMDASGQPMVKENDPAKREANKKLLLQRLWKHIATIVARYKDRVDSWDVVNEVIDPSQPNGMRNSEWYQITGTDYIETAFRAAREAGAKGKLYINEYSTTDPVKRDLLYKLVKEMLAKGVPVDGIGHQMHINIDAPSIAAIDETIRLFAGLGLDNQITEMDVSVYTNNNTAYNKVPQDLIIQQGYRFKELFDEFRRLKGYISNVTFWGIADDHTWLHNRPIPRRDAPFAFDEKYQPKPAYWGMVDPSRLPVLTQKLNVFRGTPQPNGDQDMKWKTVPWVLIQNGNGLSGAFKAFWDEQHLYVLADVKDTTINGNDRVEIFLDENNGKTASYQQDDKHYSFQRSGVSAGNVIAKVREHQGGYSLEAVLPLQTALGAGKQIGFDIRLTDADQPAAICWNDFTFSQDRDTSKYGTLILKPEVKLTEAIQGTPKIDAEIDSIWEGAKTITTQTVVQGSKTATAKVRTIWDENYLYVLAEVSDAVLNKANTAPHEQDSVEFFIDENNGKTAHYEADDGQYRVNFANEQTFGSNGPDSRFQSAARVTDGGYIVEAAIPFKTIKGRAGLVIGFDVQVNEADKSGSRKGVITWNDPIGNDYIDTTYFGSLILQ